MKKMSRRLSSSTHAGYMLQDIFNVFLFDFNMPINAPLISSMKQKSKDAKYNKICVFLLQSDDASRKKWPETQNQVFEDCKDITLPPGFATNPASGANREGDSQNLEERESMSQGDGGDRKSSMELEDFDYTKHHAQAEHWMINTVVFEEGREVFCLAPVPDVTSSGDVQSLYAMDASLCHNPSSNFYTTLLREYRESLAAVFPIAGGRYIVAYDIREDKRRIYTDIVSYETVGDNYTIKFRDMFPYKTGGGSALEGGSPVVHKTAAGEDGAKGPIDPVQCNKLLAANIRLSECIIMLHNGREKYKDLEDSSQRLVALCERMSEERKADISRYIESAHKQSEKLKKSAIKREAKNVSRILPTACRGPRGRHL